MRDKGTPGGSLTISMKTHDAAGPLERIVALAGRQVSEIAPVGLPAALVETGTGRTARVAPERHARNV